MINRYFSPPKTINHHQSLVRSRILSQLSIGRSKEGQRRHLGQLFFSFQCRFQKNFKKIIGSGPHFWGCHPPHLENHCKRCGQAFNNIYLPTYYSILVISITTLFITGRVAGKVMFLQASVILFMGGREGCVSQHAHGVVVQRDRVLQRGVCTPPGWVLPWSVQILLECILVFRFKCDNKLKNSVKYKDFIVVIYILNVQLNTLGWKKTIKCNDLKMNQHNQYKMWYFQSGCFLKHSWFPLFRTDKIP